MEQNIAIILNTCDAYSDAWDVYFELLNRMWPESQNYHVVLNTETMDYSYKDMKITVHKYLGKKTPTWSEQLISTLQDIDQEYVLLMLEDDWLNSRVDDDKFRQCVKLMSNDKRIKMIDYTPAKCTRDGRMMMDGQFRIKEKSEKYRLNCQVCLWRRDYLLSILRAQENPWQFEIYATRRSSIRPGIILRYCQKDGLLFDYDWGNPIVRGKWKKEYVDKLYEMHQIVVDTAKRGFFVDGTFPKPENNQSLWRRIVNNIKALI